MLARPSSFLSAGDVGTVRESRPSRPDDRLIVTFFPSSFFLDSLAAAVLNAREVGLVGFVRFARVVRIGWEGGVGFGCGSVGGGGSNIGLYFGWRLGVLGLVLLV